MTNTSLFMLSVEITKQVMLLVLIEYWLGFGIYQPNLLFICLLCVRRPFGYGCELTMSLSGSRRTFLFWWVTINLFLKINPCHHVACSNYLQIQKMDFIIFLQFLKFFFVKIYRYINCLLIRWNLHPIFFVFITIY